MSQQQKSDKIHNTLTVYPTGVSQEMITALLNKVKELEQAQRAEDVAGFLALFDEHAVWVNGVGTRLIGKEVIKEFTQQVLPGAFADGSSATYNVEHIVVLAPDITLTAVRQTYFDSQGTVTSKGSPTYIWKHSNDQWVMVSGQNTVIKDTK